MLAIIFQFLHQFIDNKIIFLMKINRVSCEKRLDPKIDESSALFAKHFEYT